MHKLHLKSWIDKPLAALSYGMKKRFMLSMWLSLEPRLLLLDEFDSGLDDNGKALVEDLFHSQEDLTIISITHTQSISLGRNERKTNIKDLQS